MSDALKTQLHGRDHRAGGRDPIPGLPVGISWAAGIQSSAQTLTSATPKIINFSSSWIDGVSTGGVDTSTATFRIFDSDADGSSLMDAIGFYKTGVYLISAKGEWATSGTYEKVLEVQGFLSDLGLGDTRIADAVQSETATYGPVVNTVVILSSVTGDGTSDYVRLSVTQSAGANRNIDDIMLKVVRLGDYS